MTTLLFFDDYYLNRWENLRRRVGRPALVPDATFVDPDHLLASGYPTVFRDESGKWRCLYQGKPVEPVGGPSQRFPLVAESDDGIAWEIPDLTDVVPLPERRFPHQVMPVDGFGEWNHYVDTRAEDPEERLKGFVVGREKAQLWTSPNGLTWKRVEGVEWRPGAPDPPSMAFWNEHRQSHVLVGRPGPNPHPRRLAVSETRDWRAISQPELALRSDALDPPLAELYGMPVFPYEGMYIGFVWVYHTVPYQGDDSRTMHKYWGGKTDCQLSYSYNGWHFQRSLREPLLPNAPTGDLGAGIMRPMSMIVEEKQGIRIYSSSSKLEHGYHIERGDWERDLGALLMHGLRLDGFMYVESAGGPGVLGTRPLFWRSGEPRLNVQSGQEVRVQVTDTQGKTIEGYGFGDCEPFLGDELFWEPRWKNRPGLSALSGRLLRLEISLDNACLYAIRGDFVPVSNRDVRRFNETGKEPIPRAGG